jgi:putative lysine transport system permease protein
VISVTELYFNGKSAAGIYYRYFEVYFLISILYFIMTFACARLLRWAERKIDGSGYYQLVDPLADPTGTLPTKKKAKGVMRLW